MTGEPTGQEITTLAEARAAIDRVDAQLAALLQRRAELAGIVQRLKPVGGFCAETGGAMTLFIATALGIPVSTTHTITGAIVGVGSTQRMSAVRWGVAGNIVWAWIFTIPASAFVAAIAYWISLQFF